MTEPTPKTKVLRTPDPQAGYETVEVPGKGGYIFEDGVGWFDAPIAKILIDAGVAVKAPESPLISIPSGIVAPPAHTPKLNDGK